MSDGQEPAGMSAADSFNMNMARQAGQGGGDGGGGIMGVLGRFLGINWEQPQGFAAIMSHDLLSKNVPSLFESMLATKSWVGGWLDDLIGRVALQGDMQGSAAPVEAPADTGAGVDTSGGEGGGGPSLGSSMFESASFSDGVVPPEMPDMGGGSQGASVDVS